jgi:hypothetical protein
MIFTTIADLLADPVLGKLEEVQRLLKHEEDYEYTQPCYWRAALLAVAAVAAEPTT